MTETQAQRYVPSVRGQADLREDNGEIEIKGMLTKREVNLKSYK
ncbi:hypothetical protein [Noviherbaspirillum pedocola]|nr:hypothetical protein [Noviherbaspirillum pedocola]